METDDARTGSTTVDELLGDRYEIGALLGSGGAADVHAALDVHTRREVAVKVFRPDGDGAGRSRFAAEAGLLAGLAHPGLVPVLDISLRHDPPYLVMPRVTGGTLRSLMNQGPLAPRQVARLGEQLASALAHVHSRAVVHRDIKPSNVLLDENGDCYLADFGVARLLGAAHVTGTGEFVGTARYLAPEQVTGGETGPPVDVYALGLVMLECLTGRPEYTGTPVEVALVRLSRQPCVPDGLPGRWRALLSAMTAREAVDRPTADRCAAVLESLVDEPAVPLPRQETAPADGGPDAFLDASLGSTDLTTTATATAAATAVALGPATAEATSEATVTAGPVIPERACTAPWLRPAQAARSGETSRAEATGPDVLDTTVDAPPAG